MFFIISLIFGFIGIGGLNAGKRGEDNPGLFLPANPTWFRFNYTIGGFLPLVFIIYSFTYSFFEGLASIFGVLIGAILVGFVSREMRYFFGMVSFPLIVLLWYIFLG